MQEKIENKDLFPDYEFPSYPAEIDNPYIVIAFYTIDDHWKVFNGMYKTQEAAKEAANNLKKGWVSRRIYCLKS